MLLQPRRGVLGVDLQGPSAGGWASGHANISPSQTRAAPPCSLFQSSLLIAMIPSPLLALGLICSSLSSVWVATERAGLRASLSVNVIVEHYKFPSKNCFSFTPQISIHILFSFFVPFQMFAYGWEGLSWDSVGEFGIGHLGLLCSCRKVCNQPFDTFSGRKLVSGILSHL